MKSDDINIKRYIGYTVFVSISSVIVWFTKEMFFTISIFIFISFEILILIIKYNIRKLLMSIGSLFIVISVLAISINCFRSMIKVYEQNYFEPRIFAEVRYFVVGEYGFLESLSGEKTVSVVNEEYKAIDIFIYDFDNKSLKNYYLYCMKNYPSKVIKRYIDNYLILCGVYESFQYIDRNEDTIVVNIQK